MENQPKKSRAFIITFVIVAIILALMYGVYSQRETLFTTKGTSSTNEKNFTSNSISDKIGNVVSSLFGSGKKTPSNTNSNGTGTDTNNSNTNNTGLGSNGNLATGGNGGAPSGIGAGGVVGGTTIGGDGTNNGYSPLFNPIPTPGGNTPKPTTNTGDNVTTTDPTTGYVKPTTDPSTTFNSCPDDPLVFTAEEQATLDDLLRQFYVLAPSLKSDSDTNIALKDVSQNLSLIDRANRLTADCNAEKADPNYTGPQTIKANPYYSSQYSTPGSYLPGQSSEILQSQGNIFQQLNIWDLVGNLDLIKLISNKMNTYSDFEKLFSIW